MNQAEWDDTDCSCHLHPPCNKCMNTCPECREYITEDGFCQTCSNAKLRFILNLLLRSQNSRKQYAKMYESQPKLEASKIYRETEIAIGYLKDALNV